MVMIKKKVKNNYKNKKEDENKDDSGDDLPEYDDGEWKGPVIWH